MPLAGALGAELTRAADALLAPPRVVVVGRVGVGKTTLVNRWSGAREPTGLGGVTRADREHPTEGVVLIDTPGIDDPDRALDRLGPLLDGADAVVWVVDGLQPVTASERGVLGRGLPAGLQPQLVVARADLLHDDDRPAVVARVRALAHLDADPAAIDARTGPLPALPSAPTPWQLRRAVRAVEQVRAQVEALPPPPTLADLQRAWRARVKAVVEPLLAAIEAGSLTHKGRALQALRDQALRAVEAFPVPMPLPGPYDEGVLAQLVAGLSGAEGAQRVLKAEAARWLAEGQVALAESDLEAPSRERRALLAALDTARTALKGDASPESP